MGKNLAIVNANVLTMDPIQPQTDSFEVFDGRFGVVGLAKKLDQTIRTTSSVVDLGGKTVIPGIIESHNHLSDYALTLAQVDCSTSSNRCIDDVLSALKTKTANTPPGDWIKGWGYDDTLIDDKRHLTLTDLDQISTDHPIFIAHISGHLAYANSRALEIADLNDRTPDPLGGEIHKDATGALTGILLEDAQPLVTDHIPPPSVREIKALLKKALNHYHRFGITSIHDAAIGYFEGGPEVIRAYHELETEGLLSLRVYLTVIEALYRNIFDFGLGTGFGSEHLKLGSVKLLQDGSIQALTAALNEPYLQQGCVRSDLLIDQERLNRLVAKYHRAGLQVAVHANGDRAIESVLQAFEAACEAHPGRDHRHMLIHCQLASADHIRRMKSIGVIPSYFVNHVYYWGDRHLALFLGPERASRIDPLGTSARQGLRFSLHSDCPVTPVDPLFSIHCAVNRRTRDGKILGAGECISPLEALKAYTIDAAYCSFEEHIKGSIETGKLADFTVLSQNPLTVDPLEIKDIQVEAACIGGQLVYGSL